MCGRAKGTGSLVKRGKFFMAVWKVKGRVYTRTTKCTNKREALEKLSQFVHPYQVDSDIEKIENLQSQINVLRGEKNQTSKKDAIRLRAAVDMYLLSLNQQKLVERTISRYVSQMNVFIRYVKKEYMYEVTDKDVENFLCHIRDTRSISTYNTQLKVLKRIFKVCMLKDSNIRKNHFAQYKCVPDTKLVHRRALTDSEITRLIEEAGKISDEMKLLFKLGNYTGMRKEDCVSLRKDEVDLDARLIRRVPIKTIRTGITAIIPIADEIYDDLKTAIFSSDNKDGIYVLKNISQMPTYKVSEYITKIFKNAKVETKYKDTYGKIHHLTGFHAFRHTLTKRLYSEKMPLNKIMLILGHKTVDMSMHYGVAGEADMYGISMSSESKTISVLKKTIELVKNNMNKCESFSDAIHRLVETGIKSINDEYARQIQEAKDKELEEIKEMVDEMFKDEEEKKQTFTTSNKKETTEQNSVVFILSSMFESHAIFI